MTHISDDTNQQTLQSYEAKVQEYINGTPQDISPELKAWIDAALKLMPKDGKILELGSGFGRDAAYIQSHGYHVECSDATVNFVKLLQEKGFDARVLNAITDDMGSDYDLIFASAVLLHFTTEETEKVLDKIAAALKPSGIFAFSVKQGDGTKWTDEKLDAPRFFNFWQPDSLKQLVTDHGFEVVYTGETYTGHNNAQWIHLIVKKS